MCQRLLSAPSRVVTTRSTVDEFFAFTDWIPSAEAKEAWWKLLVRNPTAAFHVKPCYQVAQTDPSDDQQPPVSKVLAYKQGSGANIDGSGYADTAGRYLTDWQNIEGDTGVSITTPGTAAFFWVRFGVLVRCDTGSATFERGELELTVAARA